MKNEGNYSEICPWKQFFLFSMFPLRDCLSAGSAVLVLLPIVEVLEERLNSASKKLWDVGYIS